VFNGALPWERTPSSEENFRRRLNTPPRQPCELNPKLDKDVGELLLKAIAKDPLARFSSARAFKEALEQLERQDY
jgi:hypothetical protein